MSHIITNIGPLIYGEDNTRRGSPELVASGENIVVADGTSWTLLEQVQYLPKRVQQTIMSPLTIIAKWVKDEGEIQTPDPEFLNAITGLSANPAEYLDDGNPCIRNAALFLNKQGIRLGDTKSNGQKATILLINDMTDTRISDVFFGDFLTAGREVMLAVKSAQKKSLIRSRSVLIAGNHHSRISLNQITAATLALTHFEVITNFGDFPRKTIVIEHIESLSPEEIAWISNPQTS